MGRLSERVKLWLQFLLSCSSALLIHCRNLIRRHWRGFAAFALVIVLSMVLATPWGCSPNGMSRDDGLSSGGRLIRVRLMQGLDQLTISASQPALIYLNSDPQPNLPPKIPISFSLTPSGWRIGNTVLSNGELIVQPGTVGSVRLGDIAHRGRYRLVPVGGGRFDVVNDVDLDDYLKGVLPAELYPGWMEETYKAQAIAARTYALYEKYSATSSRHWDVYADTRSQAYGGLDIETPKGRQAVDETSGIVLTYGPQGEERIFKTYFSSCCGGVTQSAWDVFGDPFIQPLSVQRVGGLCSISPKFNWPPVVVTKTELTRRFKLWATLRNRAESNMGLVRSVEVSVRNPYGRPIQFRVTNESGQHFTFAAEEMRTAVNTEAQGNGLPSSFVENVITESDRIRFVGGHGHGHGVGLCQWCAEARARAGMRHEDIVIAAYPGARLMRAY
jgi:stage II sporulation protein D